LEFRSLADEKFVTDLPNEGRKNLQAIVNATVSRIIWGKAKNGDAFATGVEYINSAGKKLTVVRVLTLPPLA
jgi:hypothetical protein